MGHFRDEFLTQSNHKHNLNQLHNILKTKQTKTQLQNIGSCIDVQTQADNGHR